MKYSVCIDLVTRGLSDEKALCAVKDSGLGTIEFWGWKNRDMQGIKTLMAEKELDIATFCTLEFNLVDPSKRDIYMDGLVKSCRAANDLGSPSLITQVGADMDGVSREKQALSLIDGLKRASKILEEFDVTLLVEPLNTKYNHAGYYLASSKEAFDIVDEVDSPYVKILYDIYHQQITEGDIIKTIQNNIDKIGHFHSAGHPGRNELYKGENNYPYIIAAIDETGYDGYLGLEYSPTDDVAVGLKWVKDNCP